MADTLIIQVPDRLLYSPRLKRWVLVSEVTSKTSDDLFLFVPLEVVVAILNGIIGRAQACPPCLRRQLRLRLRPVRLLLHVQPPALAHRRGHAGPQEHRAGVGQPGNRSANPASSTTGAARRWSPARQSDHDAGEGPGPAARGTSGPGNIAMKSRHPNDDVFALQPGAAAGREAARRLRPRRRPAGGD
ncbi:MAG: hypothetical protein R3F43_23820 [bacterium]